MQKHSFVIPAYKDSPYLEACIQSLFHQTEKSEVILSTSTPSSFHEALAKKYKLHYRVNNVPGTIADDWNFALSQANTPLITIAHQDDIYHPEYTAKIRAAFDLDEKALMAFTGYEDLVKNLVRGSSLNAIVKSTLLWPFLFSKQVSSRFFKKAALAFGDPISCPTVTLNFNAIQPGFQFSTAYSCALDWLAWLELAKQKGSFIYIPEKLVKHRIHSESETTSQIQNGKRQQEEYQIFEQLWGKPIAKCLSAVYKVAYKDNVVR